MSTAQVWLAALGTALAALAMGYTVAAWVAMRAFRAAPQQLPPSLPPVTVLKPLCGQEPDLYADLRSFCEQNYPAWQIVFGVRDAHDPALAAVHRLQAEFPQLDLQVAINPVQHGTSSKVSNLVNMMPLTP